MSAIFPLHDVGTSVTVVRPLKYRYITEPLNQLCIVVRTVLSKNCILCSENA